MKISSLTKELIQSSGKNQKQIADKLKNIDRRFISRVVTGQSKAIKDIDSIFEELLPDITAEAMIKAIELIRSSRDFKQ